jgi:hypothetical protein
MPERTSRSLATTAALPAPAVQIAAEEPSAAGEHPAVGDLCKLLTLADERGPIIRHVLSCPLCLRRHLLRAEREEAEIETLGAEQDEDAEDLASADSDGPGAAAPGPALLRGIAHDEEVHRRCEADALLAPDLYAKLMAPEKDRDQLLASEARFASPGLAALLLDSAKHCLRNRPQEASSTARQALAIIGRLGRDRFGAAALLRHGDGRLDEALGLSALESINCALRE